MSPEAIANALRAPAVPPATSLAAAAADRACTPGAPTLRIVFAALAANLRKHGPCQPERLRGCCVPDGQIEIAVGIACRIRFEAGRDRNAFSATRRKLAPQEFWPKNRLFYSTVARMQLRFRNTFPQSV
jgi:hypothetical protein